jgi:branched-chain amino acid transport system substrate-binding protein
MSVAPDRTRRGLIQAATLAAVSTTWSARVFAQQGPLKIGMIAPLTGVAAAFGTEYAEGAKAYVKAWNQRGGFKGQSVGFELIDDESTSVGSLSAFKRLASAPDTSLIWLASASSAILAVKAVTDEYKVPVICGGIVDQIGVPPAPYLFKVAPGTADFQKALIVWMAKKSFKRIGVMYPNDGYGQAEILTIKKLAADNGAEIVASETFQNQDTNFATQLTKLRASRPDVVYIAAAAAPAILIYKQYRQLRLQFPLAMTQATISRTFFESIGGAANAKGLYMATNIGSLGAGVPGPSGKLYAEMEKALEKKGTLFTTFGWDHGILTEWATAAAGTDRKALRDRIERAKDLPAINGPFTYTPENHIGQDYRGLTVAEHDGERFVIAQ